MKKLIDVLKLAEGYLDERGVESARLNAERLLASILNTDRMGLYLQFDRPLVENELETYRELLKRRSAGEPLQYILGSTGFRGLALRVGPGVLIPRPETEQLTGLVLERLDKLAVDRTGTLDVLDMCAGSGAVGLALAAERDDLRVVMAELSPEAADWALTNIRVNSNKLLSPVSLLRADLFGCIREEAQFDVVVANPPYVSSSEMTSLPPDVSDHEPVAALAAGVLGLDVISRIITGAYSYMPPGGLLALEIGETQQHEIEKLFAENATGRYKDVQCHSDLAGKPRFFTATAK